MEALHGRRVGRDASDRKEQDMPEERMHFEPVVTPELAQIRTVADQGPGVELVAPRLVAKHARRQQRNEAEGEKKDDRVTAHLAFHL